MLSASFIKKAKKLKEGNYCRRCLSERIKKITPPRSREYYRCQNCGFKSPRYLNINQGRKIEWTVRGIRHFGSGAFIWRRGKLLLIRRPRYPFAYTIPGGHMHKGETPLQTLQREISEETGLRLKNPKLIYHGLLPGDRCRKGGDLHIWWLYQGLAVGKVRSNKESKDFRWVSVRNLRNLRFIYCAYYLLKKFGLLYQKKASKTR